jgi:hypothetical protein
MILVRTSVVEYGLYRDDYDAFVAALEAEGFSARVAVPEEQRGASAAVREVGIWLISEVAPSVALALIVDAVVRAAGATFARAKRGRRTQGLRRLPIYGPNGEVLAWVELAAAEDDGA